ncbi:MAG: hypothetical protein JOZ80_12965 [Acidobacteriaceae bacterium]|nr:hypothetical protein [Acidobacteriaceae bacterium]
MMPIRGKNALLMLLLLVALPTAAQSHSAAEQFRSIRAKLKDVRKSSDWPASLAAANDLVRLLNRSPESLLELARAEVHVNQFTEAFRDLEEFVRMGQATDLLETSPEFAALRQQARFAEIAKAMSANLTRVSLSSTAFQLSSSALLAEDLDYDPASKRFLISSVREKKIVWSDTSGTVHDFAKAPDNWPMLAIKIDSRTRVVWATEVALQGFIFAPEADWGRSAIVCFKLDGGKLLRRIEAPRGTSLGDMALAGNGDVIVSDGEGGGVYRVTANAERLQRLDDGDFISPQTPAVSPDGHRVFVPDYVRGIGILDLATKELKWLSMQGQFALNGIDGLYFKSGKLIAVQNGTSPERVVAFTLEPSFGKVLSEKIIEQSTETLGDPTHGVIVGDEFYYIANSGWDVIDEHGNLNPGAKMSEPRVMRVPLGQF